MRIALLVGWALFGVGGCSSCGDGGTAEPAPDAGPPGPSCTAEMTAGRGTHRVSEKIAGRSKETMRKVLFEKGCTKICKADGVADDALAACVARCQVDIVADQVGVRFRCDE